MSDTTIKHVSVISDAFGTMAVRVLGMGLVFATTVVSANVLGPLEFGAFNAGLSLTLLLASLLPMGTDRVLVRNLAMVRTPGEAGADTALAHISSLLAATCLFMLAICQRQFAEVLPIPDRWLETSMLAVIMIVPFTLTSLRQRIALPLIGTRLAVLPEQTLVPIAFLSVLGVGFRDRHSDDGQFCRMDLCGHRHDYLVPVSPDSITSWGLFIGGTFVAKATTAGRLCS